MYTTGVMSNTLVMRSQLREAHMCDLVTKGARVFDQSINDSSMREAILTNSILGEALSASSFRFDA